MENKRRSGVSLLSLLGVLFIGLKLTNYVTWSWWLVLSPLWVPIAIPFGVVFAGAIVALISMSADIIKDQLNK